ncbi:glycosyltransferase family 2 protein [Chitinophaga deserti]|uniref:glycosyltransferase family 2 protein n=1 Tax=Chitinophaga deserti TaxID=2164099 RepID=UPI000D6CFED7|nr:glycosyltransferase family 2 protein [Chitinophaga deserti]
MKVRSFSIIIPTYGRSQELFAFIESATRQKYNLSLLELIIVDQNDKIDLTPGIQEFEGKISIKHIKTTRKGIAHAKNLGLDQATHEIVSFADDDCTYYEDTIAKANDCLNRYPDSQILYGKLYDRKNNKNVLREWKSKMVRINIWNYHLNYSAITCFTPIRDIRFDERFGVGTEYGMGEELDWLLQSIEKKYVIHFTPEIEIWHPELHVGVMPLSKVKSYARGYGAICKKHISLAMIWNLSASSAYQLACSFMLTAMLRKEAAHKRYWAFRSRLEGFFKFKTS